MLSGYSETLVSSGFRRNIHNNEAASPKVLKTDYAKKGAELGRHLAILVNAMRLTARNLVHPPVNELHSIEK
jgi:hypothetical protein